VSKGKNTKRRGVKRSQWHHVQRREGLYTCGKDNEFRGESGLFVLWLRVKDLYIFYFCVMSLLLFWLM